MLYTQKCRDERFNLFRTVWKSLRINFTHIRTKIEDSKKCGIPKKHRSFEKLAILWMIWCCPNHFFGNLQFNMDHFLHASLLFGTNTIEKQRKRTVANITIIYIYIYNTTIDQLLFKKCWLVVEPYPSEK